MNNGNQKPGGDQLSMRDSFNLVYIVLKSLATCFAVFTRHTFGREALGWSGIGAFLVIVLYGTFANAPEMLPFLCLWLAALAVQRMRTAWVLWHGWKLHSRCGGHPWLGFLLPVTKSYRGALLMEFAIVGGVGVLLCSVSEAVGNFTIAGACSMLLVYGIERRALVMEIGQMRDAEIEMRTRTEIYQGNHTDF